jgi:hypothetical protein
MKMSQGNFLFSYLKQRKMSFFSSFFYKIREQKCGTGLVSVGAVVPVGGEDVGKGVYM